MEPNAIQRTTLGLAVKENVISLTVPNTVSIGVMAFVAFTLVNIATSFFMGSVGGANAPAQPLANGN